MEQPDVYHQSAEKAMLWSGGNFPPDTLLSRMLPVFLGNLGQLH